MPMYSDQSCVLYGEFVMYWYAKNAVITLS